MLLARVSVVRRGSFRSLSIPPCSQGRRGTAKWFPHALGLLKNTGPGWLQRHILRSSSRLVQKRMLLDQLRILPPRRSEAYSLPLADLLLKKFRRTVGGRRLVVANTTIPQSLSFEAESSFVTASPCFHSGPYGFPAVLPNYHHTGHLQIWPVSQ